MTGFYSVMRNLQEDYKTYSQNYSKEALELLSKSTDFINAVEAVRTLDSIRRINDEGIDELTELSRTISPLYHLRGHGKGVKRSTPSIADLSYSEKIQKAIEYSSVLNEILEEIGDVSILVAQMAAVSAVMIGLAATGYGAAAEALGFVLLAVGAAFAGRDLLAGIIELIQFFTTVDDVKSEEDRRLKK